MVLPMGFGDSGRASKDEAVVNLGSSGEYARKCTVRSNGARSLFALVNVTAATFDAQHILGNTIEIPTTETFTFEGEGNGDIRSVCIRTDTGNTGYLIGAY